MGEVPDLDVITRVIDQIILPAATRDPAPIQTTQKEDLMTEVTSTESTSAPGRNLHLGWALVLISIAQLMVVLDASIANIALPYIGDDLNIDDANLTWIVTGYALAFGGLLLLGGRLGDLYGRRRIFMIGLAIFAVASLLGGLAQNEGLLLGARGLQGLGAALASPAALALITTTFPAGPARNRAFAVYATMSGAGAAVGLILGGWLTGPGPDPRPRRLALDLPHQRADRPGRGLPRAALPQRVRVAPRPARRARRDHRHARPARRWSTASPAPARRSTAGATPGPSPHWPPASLLLASFAFIESRVKHPLLPVRVFANRTRATSFLVMVLVPAAMFAMFYFLSLFIQLVVGYSPLHTGFAFLPFSVGHRDRRGHLVEPGQPDRPALHRRRRHPAGDGSPVRLLASVGPELDRRPARGRPGRARRKRRQLLDRPSSRSSC